MLSWDNIAGGTWVELSTWTGLGPVQIYLVIQSDQARFHNGVIIKLSFILVVLLKFAIFVHWITTRSLVSVYWEKLSIFRTNWSDRAESVFLYFTWGLGLAGALPTDRVDYKTTLDDNFRMDPAQTVGWERDSNTLYNLPSDVANN